MLAVNFYGWMGFRVYMSELRIEDGGLLQDCNSESIINASISRN